MKTQILRVSANQPSLEKVRALGRLLTDGGLVAFPTETVYGLAASRDRPDAVRRLRELKGREPKKPLTVHLPDRHRLSSLAAPLTPIARRLVDRLWPGPLTLVLPDIEGAATGFRLPGSRVARALLSGTGSVVVATSANPSGAQPLVRGKEVTRAFEGKVAAVIDSGTTRFGGPSTVVRVSPRGFEFLRSGVLSEEEVCGAASLNVLFVCTGNLCRSPMAEGILKAMLAKRLGVSTAELPRRGILIHSAGTGSIEGEPATPAARRSAAEYGADLTGHVSRPITTLMIRAADEIYVAAERHGAVILDLVPEAKPRVKTMLPGGENLKDPYGRTEAEYRDAAKRIREALPRIADRLLAEP